jgi:hypothetical protein
MVLESKGYGAQEQRLWFWRVTITYQRVTRALPTPAALKSWWAPCVSVTMWCQRVTVMVSENYGNRETELMRSLRCTHALSCCCPYCNVYVCMYEICVFACALCGVCVCVRLCVSVCVCLPSCLHVTGVRACLHCPHPMCTHAPSCHHMSIRLVLVCANSKVTCHFAR